MTRAGTDGARIWRLHLGDGPLVATAIHDGHAARDDAAALFALDDATRLREEDPFTAEWTEVAPTRVVVLRSRFEVDLNRPRDQAVYRKPEDAWGLNVWKRPPPDELVERSLAEYDAFYAAMHKLLKEIERRHGRFVVYDLHTYNHCRDGPHGPVADPATNPQVNVGTGTMDRRRWTPVVDGFLEALRAFDFPGGKLDVRENVKFQGGHWSRWIHQTFPRTGVALAIEVKKFFMNEWTGELDSAQHEALRAALAGAAQGVREELENRKS